ncbi:GDP-mannose 4,6-dehydratase [Patescibacteria group bacterium]
MKTYLLTGGAGFIGSHLTEALLERGHRVICIDDFNDYYNPRYKHENIELFKVHKNYILIKVDIADWDKLQSAFGQFENIDAIIHIAARAGVRPSLKFPQLYTRVNVNGTQNLLELARQNGIKKFIFASSSSVYGNQKKVPFSEKDSVDRPISPYAATKRAGELLMSTYHHLYDIDTVCLRFFTVYGPKGRPDMAPYLFTEWIWNDKELKKFGTGETRRDYTYIDDIIDGVLATLDKNFGFKIINLGNSNTVTLNEFINIVESALGKKAKIKQLPMQPGDVNQTYSDITKAKQLLNFNPQTGFADGMNKFIKWYKDNRT